MWPIVPALLNPLVTKLADSDSPPLVVQLLLVVAQLTLIDAKQLIDCLASQQASSSTSLSLLLLLLLLLHLKILLWALPWLFVDA